MTAVAPRGGRKEVLLSSAVELFRTRGFHNVGIDDIGQAAGITGPGVYRHFATKRSLLVEIFDRVTDGLQRTAEDIVQEAQPGGGAGGSAAVLQELIAHHVDFAVADRALISVYLQEELNLAPADRRRIRRRQRVYLQHWIDAMLDVHPELTPELAACVVHAAIGLISSVAFYQPKLDREALRWALTTQATRLLLEPAGQGPAMGAGTR